MSLAYAAVFRDQPEEHSFVVPEVTGTVPESLSGSLLRTGPGITELGDHALNFFEGHPLVGGLTFGDGPPRFRSRFVRTPLYEQETREQRIVQRRLFSNHPSRWSNLFALKFGNSGLHDVYVWGTGANQRVVAGNDPGHFALDPRTLATLGEERWNGTAAPGEEMSPMPYRDPATGHFVAWIKTPGGLRPDKLRYVEFDDAGKVVHQTPAHPLAASPVIVHEHRSTPNWHIVSEAAARLSALPVLWGSVTVFDALLAPAGATADLLLAPRRGDGPLVRVPLPAPYEVAFHTFNAYEDGEHVVADVVAYGGRVRFDQAVPASRHPGGPLGPKPRLLRLRVDPKQGRLLSHADLGTLPGEAVEVADSAMGRAYRYAWFSTPAEDCPDPGFFGAFECLARVDVTTGEHQVWRSPGVVSPPAVVAKPGAVDEDDAWLLSWMLDENGAHVVILDARQLDAGPLATLHLGIHLPGVVHSRFAHGLHLSA